MKFRFMIRDLVWLAVVVIALAAGWWVAHHGLLNECRALRNEVATEHYEVLRLQAEGESLYAKLTAMQQEKWFSELPVLLSGEPKIFLLRACAYAVWEAKLVRERRAWFPAHPVRVEIDIHDAPYFRKFSAGDPNLPISSFRVWMGDRPRRRVLVMPSTSTADKRTAAVLFPEADILEVPRNYP